MYEIVVTHPREDRLGQLIGRLPVRVQSTMRWLRRPSSRWARIPAGLLLILGGFLSILPVFGLWMLPLGVALLGDDIPILRHFREWLLNQLARRMPQLFANREKARLPRFQKVDVQNATLRGNTMRFRADRGGDHFKL